jgi:hypothetical protein
MVVVLIGAMVAAAVSAAISTTRTVTADYLGTRAFYAAEAGVEHALAQVELALQDGFLSDAELSDINPPTLEGFDFSDYLVIKDGAWDTLRITDGPFAGLYAITQNIKVTSRATGPTGAHSSVEIDAQAQAIPLFQFAAFGNGAMEAYTGSRSDTWGRAHVNGDIYMATNDHHLHTIITTPGKFIRDGRVWHKPQDDIHIFVELSDNSEVEVDFDSEDTPDPEVFKNKSDTRLEGRLRTGAMGVDSLKPPLPDGIVPRELIRPREASDSEAERAAKFAWQADMYVTVDLTDIRDRDDVCDNPPSGTPSKLPTITVERPSGGTVPNDDDKCDIFRFEWEAFHDKQEWKFVDVLTVRLNRLRTWVMADSAARAPRIIYVEFVPSSNIVSSGTTDDSDEGFYFPVLRLEDGERLHGPLTIGTEYPLYVQGDYNNLNKQAAAVFGDRLTVLSGRWDEDANDVDDDPMRGAEDTEMFFSIITGESEGYIGCYHEGPDPGCIPTPAGKGPGVTVQMLEDWRACGGKCLHRMIGSFITFWSPQIANPWGSWPNPNQKYKSPQRDWSFDFDLSNPENLPPGTPNVGFVLRASFRESY